MTGMQVIMLVVCRTFGLVYKWIMVDDWNPASQAVMAVFDG
jgi:hypothetical protein